VRWRRSSATSLGRFPSSAYESAVHHEWHTPCFICYCNENGCPGWEELSTTLVHVGEVCESLHSGETNSWLLNSKEFSVSNRTAKFWFKSWNVLEVSFLFQTIKKQIRHTRMCNNSNNDNNNNNNPCRTGFFFDWNAYKVNSIHIIIIIWHWLRLCLMLSTQSTGFEASVCWGVPQGILKWVYKFERMVSLFIS